MLSTIPLLGKEANTSQVCGEEFCCASKVDLVMHHSVSFTHINFFLLPDNEGKDGTNFFLKYVYSATAELSALIARGSKLIRLSPAKLVTLDKATYV